MTGRSFAGARRRGCRGERREDRVSDDDLDSAADDVLALARAILDDERRASCTGRAEVPEVLDLQREEGTHARDTDEAPPHAKWQFAVHGAVASRRSSSHARRSDAASMIDTTECPGVRVSPSG